MSNVHHPIPVSDDPLELEIIAGPDNSWFYIERTMVSAWIYKYGSTRAYIQANITHFKNVLQWKANLSRVINNVVLTGKEFSGSDLEELKELCEDEAKFLESIKVPERKKNES